MPAPRRPAAPRRTRRSIRPYFTDMPGCRADRNAAPPPAFQPASCAMPRSDMVVRSRRTRLDSITRTSVDASMRYAVCGMSYESADTDAEFERFVVRRRLFERAYERQRRVLVLTRQRFRWSCTSSGWGSGTKRISPYGTCPGVVARGSDDPGVGGRWVGRKVDDDDEVGCIASQRHVSPWEAPARH